jgi:beta-phosphoglucomutase-like phosphatase (HAD superfamily)
MLLIFDCDGVLVDSEHLANAAVADLMTSLGHPMTTEEAIGAFAGRSLSDVVTLAESLLGRRSPNRSVNDMDKGCWRAFAASLSPFTALERQLPPCHIRDASHPHLRAHV